MHIIIYMQRRLLVILFTVTSWPGVSCCFLLFNYHDKGLNQHAHHDDQEKNWVQQKRTGQRTQRL